MPFRIMPALSFLQECLDYDPATGVLTWRMRPVGHFAREQDQKSWNARLAGRLAGTIRKTPRLYMYVGFNHQNWLVHRIIYKMMTGEEPVNDVDHRDGDSLNNRWHNLRPATRQENNCNRRRQAPLPYPKGVAFRSRWEGRIWINGSTKYLGSFDTPEEAHKAYCDAAKEHFGEFWNPG